MQCLIKPGKLEEFKALSAEMAAAVIKDAGSIDYSWYVNEDGTEVHIYERWVCAFVFSPTHLS